MSSLYNQKSKKLWFIRRLKAIMITNSLVKLSEKNKLLDYKSMISCNNEKLWNLHKELEHIREDSEKNYDSYDYGSGYYYQSMKSINVSGYRNTEDRIKQLSLESKLKDKTVLDIGSNTGFLLLSLSKFFKQGIGVELNPYLTDTGKAVSKYLGVDNVKFIAEGFENFKFENIKIDVVLSLANHSTYDGNTKQTIDEYFNKISNILDKNGELIFESHPPKIEPEWKLEKTIKTIEKYFDITSRPLISMDGFLDKDRTYVIARKK